MSGGLFFSFNAVPTFFFRRVFGLSGGLLVSSGVGERFIDDDQ